MGGKRKTIKVKAKETEKKGQLTEGVKAKTERERERDTERQRDRDRETERDRERQREITTFWLKVADVRKLGHRIRSCN